MEYGFAQNKFVSISLTLMIRREPSPEQLVQMAVLVVLEAVVDQTKEWICHRRGIFVRSVRVNFLSQPLFAAVMFCAGIAVSLGLLSGIRLDCFFFGPQ